jgi:hypothetical protein
MTVHAVVAAQVYLISFLGSAGELSQLLIPWYFKYGERACGSQYDSYFCF